MSGMHHLLEKGSLAGDWSGGSFIGFYAKRLVFFFFFLKVIKSKYMTKCRTERGATYMKYIWHVKGKGCTNQT